MWVRFTAGTGIQNETKTRNKCCAGGTSVIVRKEESSKHTLRVALMFRWDQSPLLKGHKTQVLPTLHLCLVQRVFQNASGSPSGTSRASREMGQTLLLLSGELGVNKSLCCGNFAYVTYMPKARVYITPGTFFFFSRAIHKSLMKLHLG